jgi:Fe-S oxidoreductase
MRKIVRQATFGITEIESEDIWRCTTCGRCPQRCPRDVARSNPAWPCDGSPRIRRVSQFGQAHSHQQRQPHRRRQSAERRAENRAKWAEGLGVKPFPRKWRSSISPAATQLRPADEEGGPATAKILNAAGVEFGILGAKENCCGESIRKTGDEELFKRWPRKTSRPSSTTA